MADSRLPEQMTGKTVRTSTIARDPIDRGLAQVQRAVI